jgi:hypothetical protein
MALRKIGMRLYAAVDLRSGRSTDLWEAGGIACSIVFVRVPRCSELNA